LSNTASEDIGYIIALQDGDKTAMKALVEKYKKKAYFLALGIVGNPDEAMDISQEAFVRVFKSARTYDRTRPFFPWFYSIITNLCRDCLSMREKRDSKKVDIEDNSFLLVDRTTPESNMIRQEQIANMQRALQKLNFEDREIIMLKHFQDTSYDEIARLLNIPKGTVMSRLYYARKKLAKLINEYQ
jgi:RNA polymerase sigma-70 factor (ECF subfamily)